MKISNKQRDELKSLLEVHQLVTDALHNLGKSSFIASLSVSDEDNGDFNYVALNHDIAKAALTKQKEWIETELKKAGFDL